MKLNRL